MIENGVVKQNNIYGVPFRVDLIPESNKSSRPKTKIDPKYKTIHETGNKKKGANAEMHTEYVDNTEKEVSWTFTVDENEIVQELPINEEQYHSGTKLGNTQSVSIEICVDEGSDWEKTKSNAAKLCVFLEKEAGIIKTATHNCWSGKKCPETILWEGWNKFLELIEDTKSDIESNIVSEFAKVAHEFVTENGISTGERPKDNCTREEQWVMIQKNNEYLINTLIKAFKGE